MINKTKHLGAIALGLLVWALTPATILRADIVEWDEDADYDLVDPALADAATTQPASGGSTGIGGGGGGASADLFGTYLMGGTGGYGGYGALNGMGGGATDAEALAAASGGGFGGGGGGLTGGYDYDTASGGAGFAPVPAALWMGLSLASGLGVYLKSRRKA